MKARRVWVACLVAAGLGGCTVTSEQPLFPLGAAPKHALREGLWAVTGPGCEVKPSPAGSAFPECVGETMTIAGSRLDWAFAGAPVGPLSAAQSKGASATSASAQFVLIDGDPDIIEMVVDKATSGSASMPFPIPIPGARNPSTPPPVSYLSIRALEQDASGHIVRAVLWPVPCPDKPEAAPGFKASAAAGAGPAPSCEAETAEAVSAQARHMKPFLSFFVTWIR